MCVCVSRVFSSSSLLMRVVWLLVWCAVLLVWGGAGADPDHTLLLLAGQQLRVDHSPPLSTLASWPQWTHAHSSVRDSGLSARALTLVHLRDMASPQHESTLQHALEGKGPFHIHFVPNNAYAVYCTEEEARRIAQLPFVDWVGPYMPAYRATDPQMQQLISSEVASASVLDVLRDTLRKEERQEVSLKVRHVRMSRPEEDQLDHHMRAMLPPNCRMNSLDDEYVVIHGIQVENLHGILQSLSNVPAVVHIERYLIPRAMNLYPKRIVQSGGSTSMPFDTTLTGTTEVVGMGDSGLDAKTCLFDSSPTYVTGLSKTTVSSTAKVGLYWTLIDAYDAQNGHGTHVGGTVTGSYSGTINNLSEQAGIASGGQIAVVDMGCDVNDNGCTCSGVDCACNSYSFNRCPKSIGSIYPPLDLRTGYYPFFTNNDIHISTNSWGGNGNSYNADCSGTDRYTWSEDRSLLVLFAAGNNGPSSNSGTLSNEATSKNVLTVGASQNAASGYSQAWNSFTDWSSVASSTGNSIADDLGCSTSATTGLCGFLRSFTASNCCSQSGSYCQSYNSYCGCAILASGSAYLPGLSCCQTCQQESMTNNPEYYTESNLASFSSVGPTSDGRIKPDVVAPGDTIVSAEAYNPVSSTTCSSTSTAAENLNVKSGTSMATPAVAGLAATLRQWLRNDYPNQPGTPSSTAISNPTASLLKALLVNSAQQLTGQVNMGLTVNPSWQSVQSKPYFQGHGRVQMTNLFSASGSNVNTVVLSNEDKEMSAAGSSMTLNFSQGASGRLSVTLCWADYPSSESNPSLINDLDLVVTLPSGSSVQGNSHLSGISTPDRKNNVERVLIENAAAGSYSVVISTYKLVKGPQSFSVVASGVSLTTSVSLDAPISPPAYSGNFAMSLFQLNVMAMIVVLLLMCVLVV